MCTVAWLKRAVPEKTKAAVMGVCTTLVTAFACLTIFVVTETALDIRQVKIFRNKVTAYLNLLLPNAFFLSPSSLTENCPPHYADVVGLAYSSVYLIL